MHSSATVSLTYSQKKQTKRLALIEGESNLDEFLDTN